MQQSKLLSETILLMDSTNESVASICKAINVSTRWYQKVKAGKFKDPSVNKIERLYNYLSRQRRDDAA